MKIVVIFLCCIVVGVSFQGCSKKDDPTVTALPKVTIDNAEGLEGSTLHFVIRLDTVSTDTVSINFKAYFGSASAIDYKVLTAGDVIRILPGSKIAEISVSASTDNVEEGKENFSIELSNPVNCVLVVSRAIGTIDDIAPSGPKNFMTATVNGAAWSSDSFGSQLSGNIISAFGVHDDSHFGFNFFQSPTRPQTYGILALPVSDATLTASFSPHYFGVNQVIYVGQPGGSFIITSYNYNTRTVTGTFEFSGIDAATGNTVEVENGAFQISY